MTEIHYSDRKPPNVITAEQVRLNRQLVDEACVYQPPHEVDAQMGEFCDCENKRLRWVIEEAIKHPGCSSSLRAALEAAVEKWPASPQT